jgi:hypothetical protein
MGSDELPVTAGTAALDEGRTAAVPSLEERVRALELTCTELRNDRDRFLAALKGAAEMCLQNPMVVAMIPKAMKEDLRKYVGMN